MDFWNETLDLSCAVVFEGLQPSPNSTNKGPESQTSLSQRGNREAGGKVSGVESLDVGDIRGDSNERILPGLFIRKDTVNSNFIGLNSTGATIAFCMRESLKSTHGLSGAVGLDFLIEAGIHVDEAGVPKSSVADLQHLPGKSAAEAAIERKSCHQGLLGCDTSLTGLFVKQSSSMPSTRFIQSSTNHHSVLLGPNYTSQIVRPRTAMCSRFSAWSWLSAT